MPHDLNGLMKFLDRDEWRGCFEEVFDEHFGPVLEVGDAEFEDLAEVIGDDWAMILWGCAFEDFLTQDFDVEGGNIVDEYLKRRGWKEGARTKTYMKALRTSIMSLYEVSDIVPGKSLVARDLIRGGDPIVVSEGTATKALKQWDRIAARIVPVMGKNILAGGLLSFTPRATEMLLDGLRRTFGKRGAKKLPAIRSEDLQEVAAIFTLSWLFDTLDRAMNRPSVQNSDGDDIMFHNVQFPLAPGATQKDIAARLNVIQGMAQENPKFWNWLEDEPTGRGKKKQGGSPSLDTTMDTGLRVLGNVELKGRFLHLSTNSSRRADEGTTLLRQFLGELVGTPLTEIVTVDQMIAERRTHGRKKASSKIPPEMAEEVVHEFMDRQYRETLDQPVGMLGNKTPRQAAKTPMGRQKVAEWLKYLENQTAKRPDPTDPMATYSFQWMWRELGVHDLRQ
ncbi:MULTISPECIES: hypothetical protein [unclassified Mesorhizobium]|uniref:hypothetical protein n=1 Tax=unclassified Mesorhizobium TaxID=325217 RepID=UPI00112C0AFA|nr:MULTISPECIES: hypothetical protein [unclassified Mesorhizobium]TPK90482.1 hypothetical protein FJ548_06865 [Mesorhizobium sp. B2-4-17]TPL08319.1 hypothetical protein FJ938_08675 [Mesorhizobium sp. B2-4-14]